jgi:cell division protein FtsQ
VTEQACGNAAEKLPTRSLRAYFGIMDRSRREGARSDVPSESKLTLGGARRSNRRRSASLRERLPEARQVPVRIGVACGRILRRGAPLLVVLAIAGGLGAGAVAGWRFLTTSPRFAVERIEVSGTQTLTADQIRALAPVAPGDNVFRVDLDAVEARLEREPWIAAATVRRRLPHTIEIEVRERTAAALVELDALYLADATGVVFKRARLDLGEGADLPVVTGLGRDEYRAVPDEGAARIRRALAALAVWSESSDRPAVGEVRVDGQGLTLYTYEDAVAIRLGGAEGDRLLARLDTFDAAWSALTPDERSRARAIHLDLDTRPDHVTVAFAR